jgi:succinate dehydrogenase/fumarate reductase flavoprotein subunit
MINQAQIEKLKAEVNALQGNPIFQDYLKIVKVLNEGEAINEMIQRKMRMVQNFSEREPPFSHNQPQQQRRMASPQMQQQVRQRPMPMQQREREIDQRVVQAEQEEMPISEPTPEEAGQLDDLELPDLFDEELGDAK